MAPNFSALFADKLTLFQAAKRKATLKRRAKARREWRRRRKQETKAELHDLLKVAREMLKKVPNTGRS